MVNDAILKKIREDFSKIIEKKKIKGILVFGSHVKDQETNRSDIDICIVAPEEENFDLLSFITGTINLNQEKYDVRTFSELPLYIKIHIIENGILVYSPDRFELYEYFFIYRKIWADGKHRQQMTKEELLSL